MIPVPVLTAVATCTSTILGNVISAEINNQRFVRTEVKRLKVNYEQIMAMIKKAEKTATVLDDEANHWMKRVKDHMYDVEDIIDIWMINDEKRRSVDVECKLGTLQNPFSSCKNFSLRSKVYTAIKILNEDFEKILKLPLEKMPDDQVIRSYGKTAPDYNADIMGDYVQKDCDIITKLLQDSESTCRLIAIVGTVGIGKTTLARKIYHSILPGEDQTFHIKLWMRFSRDLSSLIIWSESRSEAATKAQLQKLGTELANKKCLLVIDDVWTENIWETLLEGPLQQGNRGSKVIVTTRHKHVAKRIGAGHIHYVQRMTGEDAWRLLRQRASVNQNDEAELLDIGKQIVEKCDGLPLAIRSIARTLRDREPTRHDWENACRTAFQDLSPEEQYIINLSFQDLPSHMRQCFLYCSIFPEGFSIEKRYITQHWISEGFIVKKRKSTLEETAEDCYDELVGRGLLQLEFGLDGLPRARMPIIIRAFANDVSDHENFCNELTSTNNLFEPRRLSILENMEANNQRLGDVENNEKQGESTILETIGGTNEGNNQNNEQVGDVDNNGSATIVETVEHNEIGPDYRSTAANGIVGNNESNNHNSQELRNGENNGESAIIKGLRSMKSLRTLILCNSNLPDGILAEACKLTLLRILDIHKTNIPVLPDTIGKLEHLRYLNISDTPIRRMPRTIGSLRMLQYLLLKNCKLNRFPRELELLRNLRSIDISGVGLDDSIKWNFDNMEELRSIHGFYLQSDNVQIPSPLRFPRKLTTLQIVNLQRVVELPAGDQFPLKKLQLKELELCYSSNHGPLRARGVEENTKNVLDRLHPHERLVSLKIENYCGIQYPLWMSRLRSLQRLHLQNCLLCEKLPALGDLPQLKFLAIIGFDKLGTIGVELKTDQTTAFPKLEQLQINNMKTLHKLLDTEGLHLPCLQRLRILSCPRLTTIPRNLKKSVTLTRFEIDQETRAGVENMLKDFPKDVVLVVGNQIQPRDEPTELPSATGNAGNAGLGDINTDADVQFTNGVDDNAAPVQSNADASLNGTSKVMNLYQYLKEWSAHFFVATCVISVLILCVNSIFPSSSWVRVLKEIHLD